jgi:hypothetical protein
MNNPRGNVYLFVLVASLFIFMAVTVALTVSISSRRLTSYYPAFANLYELANAGNEQVFFDLQTKLQEIYDEQDDALTLQNAMETLRLQLPLVPPQTITLTITPYTTPQTTETYILTTQLSQALPPRLGQIYVQTQISRIPGVPIAAVGSYILLDGTTLQMVHSRRL